MPVLTFKTSEECRLELVAHTNMVKQVLAEGDIMTLVTTPKANMLPVSAARASFGKEDKTGKDTAADLKLMKFLADAGHTSVFEHQSATFLIECPMFVRSQIHRHRTFAYNEISRRYTAEQIEFWIPTQVRGQAKSNKQASDGIITGIYPGLEDPVKRAEYEAYFNGVPVPPTDPVSLFKITAEAANGWYNDLLAGGVSREQARAVLPQSLLTRFYMTGNLRNWIHFIKLRTDPHAQREVQIVAERIRDELFKLWPEAMEVLIGKEEGSKTEEA